MLTLDLIKATSKKDLQALVVSGALANASQEILVAVMTKLASKSEKTEKVIVATRTYIKDVIFAETGTIKYPKGFEQKLGESNLRNILEVRAKRVHKDPVLVQAQIDIFVKDIMDGKPFETKAYTIKKV